MPAPPRVLDGSQATGDVHSDRVCIGNVEAEAMCVQVAQKLSNSFIQDVGSDGMLGCAWPKVRSLVSPCYLSSAFLDR